MKHSGKSNVTCFCFASSWISRDILCRAPWNISNILPANILAANILAANILAANILAVNILAANILAANILAANILAANILAANNVDGSCVRELKTRCKVKKISLFFFKLFILWGLWKNSLAKLPGPTRGRPNCRHISGSTYLQEGLCVWTAWKQLSSVMRQKCNCWLRQYRSAAPISRVSTEDSITGLSDNLVPPPTSNTDWNSVLTDRPKADKHFAQSN